MAYGAVVTESPKRKPAKRETSNKEAAPSRQRRDDAAEAAKARERARQRSGSDD